MLTPADRAVVRRDPAIRGLATLLDAEAFADALERATPGLQVRAARCRFVRYKPGLACVASYQIELASGSLELDAEAFADSREKKVERALRHAHPGGPFGASRVRLAESAILIRQFPDDPGLPALATLDADWLQRLLPERPDLVHAPRVTLRYKPQRRYVARLDGANGAAVLKLYAASGYDAAVRGLRAFESGAPLGVVRSLALSDADRAMVLEWVPGTPLRDRLAAGCSDQNALSVTGAALADMHRQAGRGLLPITRANQAGALVDLAHSLARVSPELSARIDRVAGELATRLAALTSAVRSVHGDFDASQVILGDARVTFIDFDRAHLGAPASDLGNFLAYLEYDALHGTIAADAVGGMAEALLSGYASAATDVPDRAHVELDAAHALLKLAPHPFRQRHPAWAEMTERVVARVEAMLSP